MEQALESIGRRDGAATMLFGVPTTFITLLNAGLAADTFAQTRYCFSAAAPLPKEIARAWEERFGHKIWEGYGLTETSPFASYNHETRHKLGSIGEAIEGVEMKVVGEDGGEVERGVWGEIVIRGPNVMLGYWNRAEDTARSDPRRVVSLRRHRRARRRRLLRDLRSPEGHDHHLRLQRLSGGGRERALRAPGRGRGRGLRRARRRCAASRSTASVVLRPGATATAEELIEFCRARIAGYKAPRNVEIVTQIPKSPTGKILKRVLRGDTA